MKFCLVDTILEQSSDRIVTVKQVTLAEEYLADHFPSFPVLPGVMMVEAMVQAARILLRSRDDRRMVLGAVRTMKFGNMVRPGEALEVQVSLAGEESDGAYSCKAVGRVRRNGEAAGQETAVSGRFTMRPVRVA